MEQVDTKTGEIVIHNAVELGTLRADAPDEMMAKAAAIAAPLKKMIEAQDLYTVIGKKRHVHVEGWTALAALLNITPQEEIVERHEDGAGYTAAVVLRRLSDGMVVGRASAECTRAEKTWKDRDDYALRSMALTRATGKACRLAFSWIMVLGGYSPTPAEEVPRDGQRDTATGTTGPAAATQHTTDTDRVPFGDDKGSPLSECSTEHLQQMAKWCREKGKFTEHEIRMRELIATRED